MSEINFCPSCGGRVEPIGTDRYRRAPITVADAMQVPEVRALVDKAQYWHDVYVNEGGPDDEGDAVLAPFLAALEGEKR